ncbi:MAG: hypothetical protein M0R03_11350 [Novosphingobium sp.]|nr:hypothetical protein [Novosphingobium sp.]
MSRLAQTLAVRPKMYRHFAVITVALTAAIFMFADDENAKTIEQELARNAAPAQKGAEKEKPRKRRAAPASRTSAAGSGGSGFVVGQGIIESADVLEPSYAPGARIPPPAPPPFMPPQARTFSAGSEQIPAFGAPGLPQALDPGKKKQAAAPARRMTPQEYEAMIARSQTRSGSGEAGGAD